ncbi:pyridoxal 5'-phosphate synthase glutaminase subunit PdxT [Candidatus Woesearchaeota archaeon]|nr:MAG: pyridoxal 5'-phosphate synthase glutaminase subunit PdxT [Candidatus Woesearchaeota archaeon]
MHPKIGILALQGDFAEHVQVVKRLKAEPVLVKTPDSLASVDALIIPGGESTTISRLMKKSGIFPLLKRLVGEGLPVYGTCAGAVLLAKNTGDARVRPLGALDISVKRNAYGPQKESFEGAVAIVHGKARGRVIKGVFIRAPLITRTGRKVAILAVRKENGSIHPVAVRQGNVIATTFHPELTGETLFHSMLKELAERRQNEQA